MTLEQLWAGWRREYVAAAAIEQRHGDGGGCVFCRIVASGAPSPDNGVVWRGELALAVLNAYPYATGHLLVLPLRHLSGLDELDDNESSALWEACRRAARSIDSAYDPDGFNMGLNLGTAAGAGIPRHLHVHVLPRWAADTNFMTTVAGVRVMPEALAESWRRLHAAWSTMG